MRARRREINIINMSLLDILCGALGAFCFMMLVALPYYIPPGSGLELRKAQEETDRLLLAISNLKDRMPDQKSVEEMERLMRDLEAQVKALQGRVNILTAEKEEMQAKMDRLAAEKEQLQAQADQLTAEKEALKKQADQLASEKQQLQDSNQQLTAQNESLREENKLLRLSLAQRNSFVVVADAVGTIQPIDLLVTDELSGEKLNGANEGFQQWLKGESPVTKMRQLTLSQGRALEIKNGVKQGAQYKVYLRMSTISSPPQITVIGSVVETIGFSPAISLPRVVLTRERYWSLLGTVTLDSANHLIFREAPPEERDAEWQALTNSTPPPTPTPTPPPTAEERAAAEAMRAKARATSEKFHKLMQAIHAPNADQAEALKLADELLQDLPKGGPMRRDVEQMRERAASMIARKKSEQAAPSPVPSASSPAPVPAPTP